MFNQEKKWIRRIVKSQHEDSANALIQKYYHEIFAYTYKKVFQKEQAMDLTQEIFIRMLQSLHQFDVMRSPFRSWLYSIAKNHIIDFYRSKAFQYEKRTIVVEALEQIGEDKVIRKILHNEQLQQIEHLLNEIDEIDRNIIIGRLFGEQKFQSLAELFNLPLSTVKTKYYKGIQMLKERLEVSVE